MTGVQRTATQALQRAFDAIAGDGRSGIWIELVDRDAAFATAASLDADVQSGAHRPLAGYTFAVKDNIDVAGIATTAACPAFAYTPEAHAPSVQVLADAGALIIGKTNLDQFATGLVGTRSPYGICPNAHWPEFVSGGSSSGSAVAVAAGHVDFALGTDTAGSGRIPAAFNGIVGIKPTRGSVSAAGAVPACQSLDCITVFAASVDLAAAIAAIMRTTAPDPADPWSRAAPSHAMATAPHGLRLGLPTLASDDVDGDLAAIKRFALAAEQLVHANHAASRSVDLDPFVQAGRLLYDGAFVAERFDAVGEFVLAHRDQVEPVVAGIIVDAADIPAWQVFRDRTRLHELANITVATWDHIDVLVVPSAPRVPLVADVLAAPIERNTMLGRFTNFVNLLDLCAITIPVPTDLDEVDAPPTSVTLIAPAWHDELLVSVARRYAVAAAR
jgi:allophanate hydrolase